MVSSIDEVWKKRPLIISGPCSAETEEQVTETAISLAATGKVDILRAGIWKPRTKPGMFEGVGTQGLGWLKAAGKKTGLPVTVEVATSKHVEEALRFEIDLFWIGARTTANPFSIQELADALSGIQVPVLIKNPINPDLELWCGAIERILKAGIEKVGMIHRGFSSYGNTLYRNAPMWQLPIEMKRRFPGMLMICDPSHICGNRSLLLDVAQKSIDLDFDGIMLESHRNPDQAWSDAAQQVTPEKFSEMMDKLVWRSVHSESAPRTLLTQLRTQIDLIDDDLLSLLSQRMKLADQIGHYKKEHNMTILQAERWNGILERAMAKADELGISSEFIIRYLNAVHMESIQHQYAVMNG
ncbi:MAG: chorismate mutase [Sphingobacteriales bacterium]|nr:chorismate mutase [Sphingobacteriales bacterium]